MSTFIPLDVEAAEASTSNIPIFSIEAGTNYPIPCWRFIDSATGDIYFHFRASGYTSGNLTLDLDWYSITGQTTGAVRWQAAIAAVAPGSSSFDFTTHAFATAQAVTTTVLGTTAHRSNRSSITISNLDSLAADNDVILKVSRLGADGADTMTGDAALHEVMISF
jgi:hypothetical protein